VWSEMTLFITKTKSSARKQAPGVAHVDEKVRRPRKYIFEGDDRLPTAQNV